MNKIKSYKMLLTQGSLALLGCVLIAGCEAAILAKLNKDSDTTTNPTPTTPPTPTPEVVDPEALVVSYPAPNTTVPGGFLAKGTCDPASTIVISSLDLVANHTVTCSTAGSFSQALQFKDAINIKNLDFTQTTTGSVASQVLVNSLTIESNGIAFLGDSITLASGPFGYRDYLSVLLRGRASLGPSNNLGVSGERTDQIDSRVAAGISSNPAAKIFVVLAGTNDVNQANRTDVQIQTSLTSIYTKLRAAGIHIVAMTIPKATAFNASQNNQRVRINDWIRGQAAEDLSVVDLEPTFDAATMVGDGIHPNSMGAYTIAKTMVPKITPLLVEADFFSGGIPAGNLNPSYAMTGTAGGKWMSTGNVANGYSLSGYDNGLTVTGSKTTLEGLDAQVITVTGTAGADGTIVFFDGGQTVTGVVGDKFEGYALVRASSNPTGLNGFGMFFNGDSILHNAMATTDPHWGSDTVTGILRTVPTVLTSGFSTSKYAEIRIGIRGGVAVNFTIVIANFGYRKMP